MSKIERIVFLIIGGIVWLYLGVRAFNVPLVHDEVVTYIAYIRDATFIPPWCYWDANNHLLNSAVSAFLTSLFGNSPFVIRMASWLSFAPLLYFLCKIGNEIPNIFKRWTLFSSLLFASYFIEFFALTRGYGMAMSFFVGTLYYAYQFSQNQTNKNLYLTSIFGVITALGSLSVIVAVCIVYLWVLIHQVFSTQKFSVKMVFKWIAIFIVPLLPLMYYVILLKNRGLLYYGGDDFIDITLKPFAEMFLTTRDFWWFWLVYFVIIVLVYVYSLYRNGIQFHLKPNQIFAFTLFLSITAIFMQHFILGVNYPADRAALYLFPLLIITTVFLPVDESKGVSIVILIGSFWFPTQLLSTGNMDYSKFWVYEYVPHRFVEQVSNGSYNEYPASINGYFLRSYIWDYAQLNNAKFPSTINGINHPDEWADFVLVDSNRIKLLNLKRFQTVDYDPISGQSLLIQKTPNLELVTRDTLMSHVKIENEFTNIFDFKGYDWIGKPMAMYFDFDVQASSEIMHTLIISTVFDTNGVEVFTNKYSFSQVSEDWTDKKGWKVKLYLPPFPDNAGRFVTYIYNPQKEKHLFPRIECKLAEISLGIDKDTPSINH